jgi:hemerythrin superfamily protein
MDAIDLLTRDHRHIEELFGQFRSGSDEERRSSVEAIIRELSIHAAVEEELFYPAVRRQMPACRPLLEHGLDEHRQAKEILAALDGMIDRSHTEAFADMMKVLQKAITDHVEEEEGELFPSVRDGFTRTALDDLGTAMNTAKKDAPTRPHPHIPANQAAQVVLGRAAAVVDRMRDAVAGRGGD